MSNEYLSICDTCGRKTWYDTEQPCHCEYPKTKTCDCCGHTETIEPIKMIPCKGTLRLISRDNLDERLTKYYERGERVEITFTWGVERMWIGKSTGWKPTYIKIARSDSSGGEAIGGDSIVSIRGLYKFRNGR